MTASQPIAGILLAGGRSSRMGGGDKGLRPLAGEPILQRIIERLAPQVSAMVINANGEPSRFARFGLPVVADGVAGYAGPLAGVHAGLEWVKGNHPDLAYAVTVATDTPFLPSDLVSRFLAEADGELRLMVARSGEGVHPVIGLWPVSLAKGLEASLGQGARTASKWVAAHGAVEVLFPDVEIGGRRIDPFFNINRPEDLAAAEGWLQAEAS
ncbi:MAG TPA: molybdenum cofactor guanylyltransferase MobA [Methyloceanibacter sp.]|jgi:molybdenum cofactor guanylyltransferase|nr:molybdenum cofactor guanylyltransferase MobA [Methyloceanibacter sp.]